MTPKTYKEELQQLYRFGRSETKQLQGAEEEAFYNFLMCLNYCCLNSNQGILWSGAAECGIRSGTTLFAQAFLSEYLELKR